MIELHNPHDSYFKFIMAQPNVASDFLTHYLPPEVAAKLDLHAPELMKDSFVDPELQQHFSDLLYRVRLWDGSAAYVGILFEHKSAPEKAVSFQVLRYKIQIWEPMMRQKDKILPPIIPVVVYHGRTRWHVPRNFGALVTTDETLRKYTPEFEYHLVDLSALSDEDIKGTVFLRAGLLLLKYIFKKRLWSHLPLILGLLPVPEQSALEYIETSMRYVGYVTDQVTANKFKEVLYAAFPAMGEKVMQMFAAEWIERGLQQGLQQGRQDGMAALTIRLLQRRIGNVSAEMETRIHALSTEQLGNLGEACLDFSQPGDLVAWFQAHADQRS
ncbi:MAG TPA: Rpn family recombination-promoting nuclease/putative transposase [Blastocatellia bacterium]|nr:Rpn family recombination-promoting nuclease/putative transposase [Blastocatellia bacterium]